ncbi:hypothetical protein [Variovorax sp. Root411]|uniref:hypothetical protein n=1 Tax=Variovorax sp. Root411 TaxID=1736530 RepID=UPI001F2E6A73|nr:hypothetical protein [Variovorax sp. Root411]
MSSSFAMDLRGIAVGLWPSSRRMAMARETAGTGLTRGPVALVGPSVEVFMVVWSVYSPSIRRVSEQLPIAQSAFF